MTQIKKGDRAYWQVGPGGMMGEIMVSLVVRVVRINAESAMVRWGWADPRMPSLQDPLWQEVGARAMRIRRARKKPMWSAPRGRFGWSETETVSLGTDSPYSPEIILRIPRAAIKPFPEPTARRA